MSLSSQLSEHNGLNYVPRERNSDGRVFEHASDCRVLIDHLANLNSEKNTSAPGYHKKDGLRSQMAGQNDTKSIKVDVKDSNMGHFYIKLQDSDKTSDELDQRIEQQLLAELKINNPIA